ncbi:unnamed protein product [Lymnaea stagnalis]|uniref:Conserved oligomeric Golgi complex subunit 8 n=1 Tax=Lymnaea stagnalis TaxID=6523 RepID=A0AAV2HUN4_LYMST
MADIDVEDENILTAIFKDSFPESWQENPDFVQYLVELSSYGADRLSREPDRLGEEKAQILAETQDLAFHNYTTFIQTADCSKEIFQDFQIIEQHLEDLLQKLPRFSDECSKVIKKAQEISSSRRMNTLTLQRHTQLLEVLEMPQLMDTCVRNGYYEEALELAAHVKRLEKKHPNIPVITSIVKEVKASSQLMLNQLIQQLRANLQLPACLRTIGFLRRMDVFTEAELRIKFLQARDSWFQSILDTIPKGDPYTHINKTIEASRVHLFDIMTQFRAIFSDEDPLVSTGKEDTVHEALLFHSWVLQKISQFLVTLENDLEEGIGGRLDSILGQCMYFGLSFSRVGADFRGLLAPIFERAALKYFSAALKEANKKFEENMQSYNLLGLTSTGGLPYGMGSSQSGQLFPPTTLLDFYPLAAFCNHVLSAFNDLRLCAPLNLACKIAEELNKSLMEVNRVILSFHRAEETTFNPKERDQFEQFSATYATDLLPYLNKCLQALFPPTQLATALGITVTEMNKKGNVGVLDLTAILSKVSHLMPAAPPQPVAEPPAQTSSHVTFTLGADAEETQDVSPRTEPVTDQSLLSSDLNSHQNSDTLPPLDLIDLNEAALTNHQVDSLPTVPDPSLLPPFASDEVDPEATLPVPFNLIPEATQTPIAVIQANDIQPNSTNPVPEPISSSTIAEPISEPLQSPFAVAEQVDFPTSAPEQGGWDTQGIDLDNLDNMTLEESDPGIDLDLLPAAP